jgi:hypothetical protein
MLGGCLYKEYGKSGWLVDEAKTIVHLLCMLEMIDHHHQWCDCVNV